MGIKLYVGNLSYSMGDSELEKLFTAYGSVSSAQVIKDRDNGRSKGFGFVEMSTEEEAEKAIGLFNGKDLGGRKITVNEARPMEARAPRRSFGGGGYHGGRGDR